MTGYRFSLVLGCAVVLILTLARVIEVMGGHAPTTALTAAFSSAVAVTLALLAGGHFRNGS